MAHPSMQQVCEIIAETACMNKDTAQLTETIESSRRILAEILGTDSPEYQESAIHPDYQDNLSYLNSRARIVVNLTTATVIEWLSHIAGKKEFLVETVEDLLLAAREKYTTQGE